MAAVARQVGVHSRTVERWRARFRRHGVNGLQDKPRPGPPPKFGPVTRLELIALACEPVQRHAGKPTRTIAELAHEAAARGIVDRISWSSYQRLLSEVDLRPHRIRGWVHSPDPQFREKVTEITNLYLHPPAGAVVLSLDEKTGMQALERRFPDRPPGPGRPRRREFEYTRHGTQSLLCAFEVHRGRVTGECGPTRTAADLVRFMEEIAGQYPTGPVHIIWDCLNIHFDGREHRWSAFNARHGHRFVFHYTPLHASWVNQVELFFSILQRQCLRDSSFRSTEELRTAVLEFIAAWNRDRAHPFRWTFTGYPLQSGLAMLPAQAA
ncbi:MAG: IS630 family transposase [Candidatus Rokuibacteriota bacterium]